MAFIYWKSAAGITSYRLASAIFSSVARLVAVVVYVFRGDPVQMVSDLQTRLLARN